jgi:hypothetical protein
MARKPTSPLKVTAILVDGRFNSADGIIMLDAILYHAWFAKHAPEVLLGGGVGYYHGHVGLPLYQLPGNRWAASRGIYTEISREVETWHKRPDLFAPDKMGYLSMEKGVISDSMGPYRAYRIPNIVHTVKDRKIEFYCVGSAEKILELLSHIPAVGKKPAMGWGLVESWAVEEIEEDYSLIHPVHGLMRPTPVDEIDLEGYPIMDYSVKPPYWKVANYRRCYVPI